MSRRSMGLVRLLSIVCLCLYLPVKEVMAESLSIDLRKGGNDPLIDFVPPPFGSVDVAQFTKDGLRIRQNSDSPGRPTGVAGFKSTIAASGDFKIILDMKINRLSPPAEEWGHGLIFSVFLDDPLQTTLKLNQIALQGAGEGGQRTVMEISGRKIQEPKYIDGPALKDGLLVIERVGKEAVFSVVPAKETLPTEIGRIEVPTEDVTAIEVWSTRVSKGNAPADITLRTLTIDADSFYSYKPANKNWFTWWHGLIAGQIAVVLGLFVYQQVKK